MQTSTKNCDLKVMYYVAIVLYHMCLCPRVNSYIASAELSQITWPLQLPYSNDLYGGAVLFMQIKLIGFSMADS